MCHELLDQGRHVIYVSCEKADSLALSTTRAPSPAHAHNAVAQGTAVPVYTPAREACVAAHEVPPGTTRKIERSRTEQRLEEQRRTNQQITSNPRAGLQRAGQARLSAPSSPPPTHTHLGSLNDLAGPHYHRPLDNVVPRRTHALPRPHPLQDAHRLLLRAELAGVLAVHGSCVLHLFGVEHRRSVRKGGRETGGRGYHKLRRMSGMRVRIEGSASLKRDKPCCCCRARPAELPCILQKKKHPPKK